MYLSMISRRAGCTESAIAIAVTVGRAAVLAKQRFKEGCHVYMSKGVRVVEWVGIDVRVGCSSRSQNQFGVGSVEGLTIRHRLTTPKPAVEKFVCVLNVGSSDCSRASCCQETLVCCRQVWVRTFVSSRQVSESRDTSSACIWGHGLCMSIPGTSRADSRRRSSLHRRYRIHHSSSAR
jgi:hypothetical protein